MTEESRFVSLEYDDILKIIDDKEAVATKNVIAGATRILHEYLQVKGQVKAMEDFDTAITYEILN